tara:strand:+ start:3734 stop:4051 length:318 start_codon:yes stop_codon:yes gene_type:complete
MQLQSGGETEMSASVLPLPPRVDKLLAQFSTRPASAHAASKSWTSLRIWQISSGKYVCVKNRGPDPSRVRSQTVDSLQSARQFFGDGWVVRELFAEVDPRRFPRW